MRKKRETIIRFSPKFKVVEVVLALNIERLAPNSTTYVTTNIYFLFLFLEINLFQFFLDFNLDSLSVISPGLVSLDGVDEVKMLILYNSL